MNYRLERATKLIYHTTVWPCRRHSTRKHNRELTCVGPDRLALASPGKAILLARVGPGKAIRFARADLGKAIRFARAGPGKVIHGSTLRPT